MTIFCWNIRIFEPSVKRFSFQIGWAWIWAFWLIQSWSWDFGGPGQKMKMKPYFDSFKIFLKFWILNIDTNLIFFLKNKIKNWIYFAMKIIIIDRQIVFFKRKLKIKTKCINENFFLKKKIRNRNWM